MEGRLGVAAVPRSLRKAASLLHRVGMDPALAMLPGCEVVFLVAGEQRMGSSSFVGGKSEAVASTVLLGQELSRGAPGRRCPYATGGLTCSASKSNPVGAGSEDIHTQLCNPRAEVGNYLGIKDELFRDRV